MAWHNGLDVKYLRSRWAAPLLWIWSSSWWFWSNSWLSAYCASFLNWAVSGIIHQLSFNSIRSKSLLKGRVFATLPNNELYSVFEQQPLKTALSPFPIPSSSNLTAKLDWLICLQKKRWCWQPSSFKMQMHCKKRKEIVNWWRKTFTKDRRGACHSFKFKA